MKPWRLTPLAEGNLADIAVWTVDGFGQAQAIHYRDALIARINALAAGVLPHPRPCSVLMQPRSSISRLTYFREGGHYIIMRETDELLEIIGFLHESSNLPDLLEALS